VKSGASEICPIGDRGFEGIGTLDSEKSETPNPDIKPRIGISLMQVPGEFLIGEKLTQKL
jgi:hypothetical protein